MTGRKRSAKPRRPTMPAEPASVAVRDAASLAIIDTINGQHFVLLGKRHANQVFVPGKYVLPGGAVEPDDSLMAAIIGTNGGTLPSADKARLLVDVEPQAAAPAALALAAIRETFEETGRLLGQRLERQHEGAEWPEPWRPFARHNLCPCLAPLGLLARAITPAGSPRRYDARFFHVPASVIAAEDGAGDGEFERIAWMSLAEAQELDLHDVTRAVLVQLDRRLAADGMLRPVADVPYMHAKHGPWTIEPL
jgi:8-oxo-dGTP pyrophosphatase MutT (NUDIX family)